MPQPLPTLFLHLATPAPASRLLVAASAWPQHRTAPLLGWGLLSELPHFWLCSCTSITAWLVLTVHDAGAAALSAASARAGLCPCWAA